MNAFSSFVASFCASSIIIGLMYLVCPEKQKNIVKFLFGIVFILSVISSFASIKDITLPDFDSADYSRNETDIAETSARLVYEGALKNSGINFRKIEVCTDKNEDGSIFITKVIIYSDANKTDILTALGTVAKTYEVEIKND